jgi:hypothetical protein
MSWSVCPPLIANGCRSGAQLEGSVYRGLEGIRRFVSDVDDDWEGYQIEPVEFHQRGIE